MKRKDNIFTSVDLPPVESSTFDLSHERKLTFQMGELVPFMCREAVPGDNWRIQQINLLRLMPLINPVMHKVRVKTEWFFIPDRIIYGGWENFITGVDPVAAPYIELDGDISVGTLADHIGIPPGNYEEQPVKVLALPFAAYFMVWDEWYRDQNQSPTTYVDLVPGNNTLTYFAKINDVPLKRAWRHDYFTSALPTPQQGAQVDIPLGEVKVKGYGTGEPHMLVKNKVSGAVIVGGDVTADNAGQLGVGGPPSSTLTVIDPNGTLVVDPTTIDDLREAFTLQAFLERSMRVGKRYFEQIKGHFNQKSPDSRLQRPELIGSFVQNMTISEVLATAQSTTDGIAVGSMAGHGISVGGDSVSFQVPEHGWIMGIISVIPDTAYMDGIDRQFTKFDRLDYLWPSFAHLGEQAILNKEVCAHDVPISAAFPPDGVWGYIPRYSEYRYIPDGVSGEFRDTLDSWHMARKFDPASPPDLNEEFILANPTQRIYAVTDPAEDHVVSNVIMKISCDRKLPRQGIPATLR